MDFHKCLVPPGPYLLDIKVLLRDVFSVSFEYEMFVFLAASLLIVLVLSVVIGVVIILCGVFYMKRCRRSTLI